MESLFAVLAVGGSISLLLTLLSHLCVHRKLSRRTDGRAIGPPVSIIRPMKGLDHALFDNLRSLAQQDYPRFEILLGCIDADDPALDQAHVLRRRFPGVDIKVLVARPSPGLNPKVAVVRRLAEAASYDLILISDSNVNVDRQYLRATVDAMARDPDVGLVTNVLAGDDEASVGAHLENLHLNSFVAGSVCGAEMLMGIPVAVGKSMLMRRSDLESLGGWDRVADVLGEDYLLGRYFAKAGYRVALCPHVIRTINEDWSVSRFVSRHLRWCQLRRHVEPGYYALEPVLNPVPWLMLAVLFARSGGAALGIAATAWVPWLLAGIVAKIGSDFLVTLRLRGRLPAARAAVLVPIKDALVLAIWAAAVVYKRVNWRGNLFRIGAGSRLYPITPRQPIVTDAIDEVA